MFYDGRFFWSWFLPPDFNCHACPASRNVGRIGWKGISPPSPESNRNGCIGSQRGRHSFMIKSCMTGSGIVLAIPAALPRPG